jgi:GNAT superfamily N-acetyltransferase
MLGESTMESIDRFWSAMLSQPLDGAATARTIVQSVCDRLDRGGIGTFLRENLLIVSIPESRMTAYRHLAEGWSAQDVWHPERMGRDLGLDRAVLIGPAFIGYTDADRFRPVPAEAARMLTPADAAAVDSLKHDCGSIEWEHGGCEPSKDRPAIGVFEAGRLAALAGYELWGGSIAHISIVTHPACRGRGHGHAAVSKLTELVLARKLIAQYRTLDANRPSMAIAGALGFERYATTVWCRLNG